MKAIFKLAFAFAALLSFAACSDVPMPYEQPGDNPKGDEPSTETVAKGTGTQADPYNVTAALKVINALASGEETPTAIYVKGAVKQIKQIETEQFGNANYYITDDGNNEIYIFQSYYLGNRKFTASDKLEVGDTVVVYGKFTNYMGNTPETVGKGTSYIYSLNGKTEGGTTPDTPAEGEAKGAGTETDPYNVAGALKVISALGADEPTANVIYVEGKVKQIKQIETEQYGNANYYITDDGNNEIYIFQSYYLGNRKFTASDKLEVGDKVIICGKFVNYKGNTPETVGKGSSYIYSLNGKKEGGSTPDTPDTPSTGEAVAISGTTVTLTNTSATAGTETTTVDLNTLGLENAKAVTEVSFPDGTKLTFGKGNGTNTPTFYDKTKGVRVYLDNTLSFTASKKIAKIEFTCDKYGSTSYVGNAAATVTFSGNGAVYTNSDPSAEKGGVQLRVKTITITYAK